MKEGQHNLLLIAISSIGIAMTIIPLDPYIQGNLLRDLAGHDHKSAAFLVYFWIYVEQERLGSPVSASHARLAEETGLSRSTERCPTAPELWKKLRQGIPTPPSIEETVDRLLALYARENAAVSQAAVT